MKKIIEQILRMPYYQNYAARSGKVHNVANHEGAVEDILIQHSLVKVERKIKKVQRDAWLNGTSDDVTEGTYISQPRGS